MSIKNPLTPAGIEPATFLFVAQHLNHCATAVPYIYIYIYICAWRYVLDASGVCFSPKGSILNTFMNP